MSRWTIAFLILALLGSAAYWFGTVPATSVPAGNESRKRFAPGPYKVISESFNAVDQSRSTPAYKAFPGHSGRELKGTIWRPARTPQPGPLLVYSHGFLSFHREGLYLVRFLASHGYSIIASDYKMTGLYAPHGNSMIGDVINQPGDVSFLIDTILHRNNDISDVLHGTINPAKIAVAGVSLGGMTSTLAAFHGQERDPRIAAAVSIAGPANMFTVDFFAGSTVPYLMIYGDSDAIVDYTENALPSLSKYPASILVTLKNGSHAGFAQPASTIMRFFDNPDGIGCRAVQKSLQHQPAGTEQKLIEALGGADTGIDPNYRMEFCTREMIPVAMNASRQHMFTTLATYSFLESALADAAATRESARHFLLETLPAENSAELSITRHRKSEGVSTRTL